MLKIKEPQEYVFFVSFIFFVKIMYIIFAIINYYLIQTNQNNSEFGAKIDYWRERCEFIFMFCMAMLTIYIFRPFNSKPIIIDNNVRFLFFVHGILLLIKARWDIFFKQSRWFSRLQFVFGGGVTSVTK